MYICTIGRDMLIGQTNGKKTNGNNVNTDYNEMTFRVGIIKIHANRSHVINKIKFRYWAQFPFW